MQLMEIEMNPKNTVVTGESKYQQFKNTKRKLVLTKKKKGVKK